jgi:hypothetical protein
VVRIMLAAVTIVLALAGCASPATGPEFQLMPVPIDKAAIYIYRPDREFNRGGYANVSVNGESKFPLKDQGYAVLLLPPGQYEFKFEGSQSGTNWWPPVATRTLGIEVGREYFVRAIPTLPPGTKPGPHLFKNNVSRTEIELVPKEQALREIAGLRLVHE